MSYDVQVWSVNRPDLPSCLPGLPFWTPRGGHWSLERKHWQVLCGSPDRVLPEDVPPTISANLPGISFVTELILEPIGAPDSARKLLARAARSVARASHGLVFDRQADEITTPRGVRRLAVEPRSERFALLELSWLFLGEDVFRSGTLRELLDTLGAHLPEAVPRRYGLYEPPQHLLAEEGREHLLSFLVENLDNHPVLYPHRPVLNLHLACTRQHYPPRLGFRCNSIRLAVEATVTAQPGWQEGLRRLWRALCRLLRPFYSEVRTVDGYSREGATYASDRKTEVHPICDWFWRGVPRELGHAVAIGPPYVDLWPQALEHGQRSEGLVVLDVGSWQKGCTLDLETPDGIRQAWTPVWVEGDLGWSINWVKEYPEIWPFGSEQTR